MNTKFSKMTKLIAILLISIFCLSMSVYSASYAEIVEPLDYQYIEFRAVSFEKVTDKDRQLIVEVWSNELDLKGFDLRYQYDNTVISHSNLTTNEYTDDETEFFEYENGNSGFLDLFTLPGESFTRMVVSLLPEEDRTSTSQKIVDRGDGIGEVLDTSGGFLIGKLSFRTTLEKIPSDLISLLPMEDTSPRTGIKVNFNGADSYEAESLFRFTDATASKDASLSDLKLSSGVIDETNPDNSTYKEYTLTPEFNKDTLNYEVTLLEYVDNMNLVATANDAKATIKIKVPKRDENGNLVYDTDGTTIIYEEKSIESGVASEVTLNKLGEQDTNITVIVTAEDGETKNEYNVVIKRPFGTIKGKIYTAPTSLTTKINKATIRIYDSDEVAKVIDLQAMASATDKSSIHTTLLSLESQNYITNDDGTYEIYVVPGKYDVLVDKEAYLDHIYISKEVKEADVIDLGEKQLFAGDITKDGTVNQRDMALINNTYGTSSGDTVYDNNTAYDFTEDLTINQRDTAYLMNNYSRIMEIE